MKKLQNEKMTLEIGKTWGGEGYDRGGDIGGGRGGWGVEEEDFESKRRGRVI